MTQDEIIEMAQECKLIGMRPHLDGIYIESLLAFAKLVAEAERERIKQANAPEIEKINAYIEHAMSEVQRLGQEIEPVADYIAARDMLDAKPVPPRTWVGLTDEDMYVVSEEESCSFIAGAKWSEEILKEKNK